MPSITTWIGASRQAYPASITPAAETAASRPRDRIVAIAVQRTTTGIVGIAHPIGKPVDRITPAWLCGARASGGTEIHIVDPCEDPQAVIADLRGRG